MQLDQFRSIADSYAIDNYFIGLDDMQINDKDVKQSFDNGEQPRELVEYFANKWDLPNKFQLGIVT